MKKDFNTEEKILQSAMHVFISKGLEGARMQEIADVAGINKALLHYYFENKTKLFDAVFSNTVGSFLNSVEEIAQQSWTTPQEKISLFVDNYIDLVAANPFIPQFMINEVNRDPQLLYKLLSNLGAGPSTFFRIFGNRAIEDINESRHLLVSVFALCLFPFVARPFLQISYFDNDNNSYEKFLSERKDYVKKMLLKFLDE